MTNTDISRGRASARAERKANPQSLFGNIMKAMPRAARPAHIAELKKRLRQDDYEEHLDTLIEEWASIKYTATWEMIFPPTEEELHVRAALRKQGRHDREARITALTKSMRARSFWDLVMPNGRPLHECTFKYIAEVSPLFAKIADLGKGRMNKRIDSVFKTAEEMESAVEAAP